MVLFAPPTMPEAILHEAHEAALSRHGGTQRNRFFKAISGLEWINLSSLAYQANSSDRVIQFYEDQICDTFNNATVYKCVKRVDNYAFNNGVFNSINMAGQYNVTTTHCQNLKSLRSQVRDLLELFLNVDVTPEEIMCQNNCHKWFVKDFIKEDA